VLRECVFDVRSEIHLGAEGGPGFFFVKIGEEGIVFAVVDAAGVETFGEDFGESGFADAEGALDDDKAGRLWATLGLRSAPGCGGFVGRHFLERPRRGPRSMDGIIAEWLPSQMPRRGVLPETQADKGRSV